ASLIFFCSSATALETLAQMTIRATRMSGTVTPSRIQKWCFLRASWSNLAAICVSIGRESSGWSASLRLAEQLVGRGRLAPEHDDDELVPPAGRQAGVGRRRGARGPGPA